MKINLMWSLSDTERMPFAWTVLYVDIEHVLKISSANSLVILVPKGSYKNTVYKEIGIDRNKIYQY